MEDMLGPSLQSQHLSSILGKRRLLGRAAGVDLYWERHSAMWGGLEYFSLTLLLISSLLQAPDSIRSAQILDWVSLALVLGLY